MWEMAGSGPPADSQLPKRMKMTYHFKSKPMQEITHYTQTSIRTFTGKAFDLKVMDPETICIKDIAHALSNTARFGGHLKQLYSVAQHSVYVATLVPEELRLAALLHDASEAYLGDMPSPFKSMLPDFQYLENTLMSVIADKYDFEFPLHPKIKKADAILLEREWGTFVNGARNCLFYMPPRQAEKLFLATFESILNN